LAGFEVTLYGRFWVTPEGQEDHPAVPRRLEVDSFALVSFGVGSNDRMAFFLAASPFVPHDIAF
jgi:hypothetical protein